MCLSKSLSRSTRACLHWLCTIISLHHGNSPVHTSPYQSDLLPAKLLLAETCLSLSHVQAADMSICMISPCVCCRYACVHSWRCGTWGWMKAWNSWMFLINTAKPTPYPLTHIIGVWFHALILVVIEVSVEPDVTLLIPFNVHPYNVIEEVLKETRTLIRAPVN